MKTNTETKIQIYLVNKDSLKIETIEIVKPDSHSPLMVFDESGDSISFTDYMNFTDTSYIDFFGCFQDAKDFIIKREKEKIDELDRQKERIIRGIESLRVNSPLPLPEKERENKS